MQALARSILEGIEYSKASRDPMRIHRGAPNQQHSHLCMSSNIFQALAASLCMTLNRGEANRLPCSLETQVRVVIYAVELQAPQRHQLEDRRVYFATGIGYSCRNSSILGIRSGIRNGLETTSSCKSMSV